MSAYYTPTPGPLTPLPETAATAGHCGNTDRSFGLQVESVKNSLQGAAKKHWWPHRRERMQVCLHRVTAAMSALKKAIFCCIQPGRQENSAIFPGKTGTGSHQTKRDKSKFVHLHRMEDISALETKSGKTREKLLEDYNRTVASTDNTRLSAPGLSGGWLLWNSKSRRRRVFRKDGGRQGDSRPRL